jgi:hypothetical protein
MMNNDTKLCSACNKEPLNEQRQVLHCEECRKQNERLEQVLNVKSNTLVNQFKFAYQIDYQYATKEIIEKYLYELGEPIVLTNTSEYIITSYLEKCTADELPKQKEYLSKLFTFDFLKNNAGDMPIYPVDNLDYEEIEDMTMRDYIEYLEVDREERDPPLLYGKDVTYPPEWSKFLFNSESALYSLLKYKGDHDLLADVPDVLQAETALVYIGDRDTFTPAHQDICGTIGHNLMMYADRPGVTHIKSIIEAFGSNKTAEKIVQNDAHRDNRPISTVEAYTLWAVFRRQHAQDAKKFWRSQNGSIDKDNCFLPFSTIAKSDVPAVIIIQRAGDMILVPPLSPHQVINKNGISIKTAWATLTSRAIHYSYQVLPEYRQNKKEQVYRIKSVAFYGLTKRIEKVNNNIEMSSIIMEEILDLLYIVQDVIHTEWIDSIYFDPNSDNIGKFSDEVPHTRTCNHCNGDIWNRCFHCNVCDAENGGYDCCLDCYASGLGCTHRYEMEVTEHISMTQCKNIFHQGKQAYLKVYHYLHPNVSFTIDDLQQILTTNDPFTKNPVATIAYNQYKTGTKQEEQYHNGSTTTKRPLEDDTETSSQQTKKMKK